MFDVITIGTATLDVFLRSPNLQVAEKEGEKDICVRYGAKLDVSEIYFESGGGGTNSAVTFARQGLKVASLVQMGGDFTGEKIIEDIKKEGVDIDLININNAYTDYSTILWAPDGGRTVLVYRGKTKLEVQDVPWEKLETKWFYISSIEGNLNIVSKLQSFKIAESKVKIAWNPGGRELEQKEELIKLLPGITLINVNKEEMEELLGIDGKQLEIDEILKKAQELPCEYVVITDDRRGAYLWDKTNNIWYHSGIYEDSPRYETTGAGDSFGSGLVSGFIKGNSLEDCLYLAAANASSVVAAVGAKKGIIRPQDLANWPREKLLIHRI